MLPFLAEDVARCIPVYETYPGFDAISEAEWLSMALKSQEEKSWLDALPDAAASIVTRIEELSGIEVQCVGIGPDRRSTLSRPGGMFDHPLNLGNF